MPPRDDAGAPHETLPISDLTAGRNRVMAMVLMVVSSVMISFGGLISRMLDTQDAWQINIYRSASIFLVVLVYLMWRYRGGVAGKIRDIGRPGLIGGVCLTIAGVAFPQALMTTTVANTLFTLSAIPFITAAFAWIFLKERLNAVTLVTMVVAGIGVGIMVGGGIGGGSVFGNVMALVTATGFSAFAVIIRKHRGIDMLPTLLVSGVMLAVVAGAVRWNMLWPGWWDVFLCFVWGGILSGIGNIMFVYASRHLMAAELTLFMLLEFALGPVWVWMVVAEVPTIYTLIGGVLVMAAVGARTANEIRTSKRRVARGRMVGPR